MHRQKGNSHIKYLKKTWSLSTFSNFWKVDFGDVHQQGHDIGLTEDAPAAFHASVACASVGKRTRTYKERYLQLTVTFTVLVSGEAMSFRALHS